MNIAVLHHHLNRGGVTSVIAGHVRAMATLPDDQRPERVVVLFDGQREGWPADLPEALPVELVVAPELAYDAAGDAAKPQALAEAIRERLAACGLASDDTLLHVHNHSLGKSASLPGALERFAGEGWRLLLQVHDFAEDNRPDNYRYLQSAIGAEDPDQLAAVLYPQGPAIHYATLTQRDADILRTAGFAERRLHTLPNPVGGFGQMPPADEARSRVLGALGLPSDARLIVYPVRGIRRKNLGEMLLLSALAPEGTWFAVTLRPKNPVEAASFDRWQRLAESLGLPCRFDTGGSPAERGHGCDFIDTLAAADAILTTSVAEGFGMVFLEAWLAGKPLVGRDLPEITREFEAAGMAFRGLWEELRAAARLDADFGRLTAAEQEAVIRQTRRPDAPLDLGIEAASADIAQNADVVHEHYSVERIGDRLRAIYEAVTEHGSGAASSVRGAAIVDHFAAPERRHPLRFEDTSALDPDSLTATIARLSTPLDAQPTGEKPLLPQLSGIRAVVFDVYGTLLVSGSGDISLASEGSRGGAAIEALKSVFGSPKAAASDWPDGEDVVAALHAAIHDAHAASESDHPEVEIRDIWRTVLTGLGVAADDAQVERLAVEYECRVNPIWPMPGLVETLVGLHGAGLGLGIVSNAQFFTPLAFEPLSGKPLEGWGFDAGLCVWSFDHREAKPGTFLYERCAEALAARGLTAEEAIFVGNDLRNDVWPAQRVGFRTALFAGDARSLRWRQGDPRLAEVRPDAVVTELPQLLRIVL